MIEYTPPSLDTIAFHCPHCAVYSQQNWAKMCRISGSHYEVSGFKVCRCTSCNSMSLWSGTAMVFPIKGKAPTANPDMPAEVRADYDEANTISNLSPRGAAGLLRLCVQKLCKHFGEPGKNINDDIGALVKKGLPPIVQQALDGVRLTGNAAVHPGELDVRDDPEMVSKLFKLVNFIVEKMITEPKQVSGFYNAMPAGQRAAVEKRDGK